MSNDIDQMITFVTAFYKLDERTYCTSSDYLRLFKPLADTGINIHLFIQPKLYDIYIKEIGVRENIYITQLEFEELPIYQQLKDMDLKLPAHRNQEKDSREFMILMNSKVEFVKRGIDENNFNSTHFAWIDFGISKICKQPDTLTRLKHIQPNDGLYIPVIWPKIFFDLSRICWRFCGGFFIGDVQSILDFYELYEEYFIKITKQYKLLTWEVNFWAYLELLGYFNPFTYYADHNDSMLRT